MGTSLEQCLLTLRGLSFKYGGYPSAISIPMLPRDQFVLFLGDHLWCHPVSCADHHQVLVLLWRDLHTKANVVYINISAGKIDKSIGFEKIDDDRFLKSIVNILHAKWACLTVLSCFWMRIGGLSNYKWVELPDKILLVIQSLLMY